MHEIRRTEIPAADPDFGVEDATMGDLPGRLRVERRAGDDACNAAKDGSRYHSRRARGRSKNGPRERSGGAPLDLVSETLAGGVQRMGQTAFLIHRDLRVQCVYLSIGDPSRSLRRDLRRSSTTIASRGIVDRRSPCVRQQLLRMRRTFAAKSPRAGAAGRLHGDARMETNNHSSIHRILIAHDFSETSEAALNYAMSLATRFEAAVTVVHAYDIPSMGAPEVMVLATDWLSQISAVARESLDAVVARAQKKGVSVDGELREGSAWREINEVARSRHADLIVVGSHGRKGLPRALLGSVAEKVVRTAPCPVLVVRGAPAE